MNRAYLETQSTDNAAGVMPQTSFRVDGIVLTLPEIYNTVKSLAQTVDVDYYIPGCPPEERTTWLALEALIQGKLPPIGTTISHSQKAVCDDCPRKKNVKKVKSFHRTLQIMPESGNMPARTGSHLRRRSHQGRLRRSLSAGQHALHRLLRRRPRAS